MAANRNGPCPPVTPVQSLATEKGWRQLKEDCRAELRFFSTEAGGEDRKKSEKRQKVLPSFLASRPY